MFVSYFYKTGKVRAKGEQKRCRGTCQTQGHQRNGPIVRRPRDRGGRAQHHVSSSGRGKGLPHSGYRNGRDARIRGNSGKYVCKRVKTAYFEQNGIRIVLEELDKIENYLTPSISTLGNDKNKSKRKFPCGMHRKIHSQLGKTRSLQTLPYSAM